MKLKICGMKFQENILEVAALQPDYLGFIFYEKSARFFDDEIPPISKKINKVGVFVNASLEYIVEKVLQYNLQAVQLHGDESTEFCKALKVRLTFLQRQESIKNPTSNLKIPAFVGMTQIIKVFSIKDSFDFEVLNPYEKVCDYFLFDTKGKKPGGNGYTFNWEVLKNYPSTKPYFLSGGIGLDEVDSLMSFLNKKESKYCYAIDVNSKFEIEPGFKDEKKLKEFIKYLSFLRRQESN